MPKLRRMTREQRSNLIVTVVRASDEPVRILEIARAMNIKRTPYLVALINELVDDRKLIEHEVWVNPDLPARAYTVPRSPRVIRSTPAGIDN